MSKFYCEHCGTTGSSVQGLTAKRCMRHPDGSLKGFHKLYEGTEKSRFTCKYCGNSNSSMMNLTSIGCLRHPNGPLKGKHKPAL